MNVHKFFYLTIQNDDLDLEEAQSSINLPCKIFHKGEMISKKINDKAHKYPPQKTNRWLYCAEDCSEISSEDFVLNQLEILTSHLTELENYIARGMAMLEIVLYAGDVTDFNFNTNHISKLNQL